MTQVVVVGLGGQGVVFVARVLSDAAAAAGMDVLCFETHGMAQRGGSVVAHARFGSYRSPEVPRGRADAAICLSPSERERALSYLRDDGVLIEAADNMEALGRAAARVAGLPSAEHLRAAIEAASRPESREKNVNAFIKGMEHETVSLSRTPKP